MLHFSFVCASVFQAVASEGNGVMHRPPRRPRLTGRPVVVLVLASAIHLGTNTTAPAADRCRNVAGSWNWFTGHNLVISADGTVTSQKASRTHPGTWTCLDAQAGKIRIRWSEAFGLLVDTLTLSHDGRELAGTNNLGATVTGHRLGGARPTGEQRSTAGKRRARSVKTTTRPQPAPGPPIERAKPVAPGIMQLKPVEGVRP